jgi:hypothetical protein
MAKKHSIPPHHSRRGSRLKTAVVKTPVKKATKSVKPSVKPTAKVRGKGRKAKKNALRSSPSEAPITNRSPVLPPPSMETEDITATVSIEIPAITAPPPSATHTLPMLPPPPPQEERPGETMRSRGPSSTMLAPQRLPAEARKPKAPSFNWGHVSVGVSAGAVIALFAMQLSQPTSGVRIDVALAQLEADDAPTAYLEKTDKHTVETLYSPPPTEPMPAATINEVETAPVTAKDTVVSPPTLVMKTEREAIPSELPITDDEMEDARRRAIYALRQETTREEEWTMEALLLVGSVPTIDTPKREAALRFAVGKLNGTGPFLLNREKLLAAAGKIAAKSN